MWRGACFVRMVEVIDASQPSFLQDDESRKNDVSVCMHCSGPASGHAAQYGDDGESLPTAPVSACQVFQTALVLCGAFGPLSLPARVFS